MRTHYEVLVRARWHSLSPNFLIFHKFSDQWEPWLERECQVVLEKSPKHMGKQKKNKLNQNKKINNGNLECWRAMWKKPKVKKQKFEDMQDKGRWSGKILERSRRTISRMLCKRHRKSFYCRHRQQLWGNKKKKFTSVTLSHSNLNIMFCPFPGLF